MANIFCEWRARWALVPLGIAVFLLLAATAVAAQELSWTQLGQDVEAGYEEGAFGRSLDVSADGSRIVVGEPHHNVSGDFSGQVRVFDLIDGAWMQVGQDLNGEDPYDNFGAAVSISADGSRIIVGIQQFGPVSRPGIARVFDLIGAEWTQVGEDLEGESKDDEFGTSVSISADGSRVAVGAPANAGDLIARGGHVRVYEMFDDSWSQIGADINGPGLAGVDLALSADGSRLVIGASSVSVNGQNRGLVGVMQWSGDGWFQIGESILGEAEDDKLGLAVDINADGSRIVVGTAFNDGAGDFAGHVRVYGFSNFSWSQLGPEIDGETAGEWLGWSVSMSADGTRIAASLRVPNPSNAGLARVYDSVGGTWLQVADDVLDGQLERIFGEDVSLSADGSRLAVGASTPDEEGVVRMFELLAEPQPDPEPEPVIMCGGFEATIIGTADNDILNGTAGPDVIAALQGDDVVKGLGGDDVLCGGTGDDIIFGGQGFDILYGAQGNDVLYSADGAADVERSDLRGMRAFGGAGDDVLHGSDRWDRMQGGPGADELFGYQGRDWMRAGAGDDLVDGGLGADDLHGGNGNDRIRLSAGDSVRGGAGARDACAVVGTPTQVISCEVLS